MYGDQPFLSLESMKVMENILTLISIISDIFQLLFHSEDKNLLDDLIRIVEREGIEYWIIKASKYPRHIVHLSEEWVDQFTER